MSTTDTMAQAVAVKGATKMVTPAVQRALDAYHDELGKHCDNPGETTAVMMMDGLSFAAASCRSEARPELREVLKKMVDIIFDTAEEHFPSAPVVLH